MKKKPSLQLLSLVVLLALPAQAQEQIDAAPGADEGDAGLEEPAPAPSPTEAVKVFDCVVDSVGERCTVPISEGESVDGVVAYKEEHTGKWIDFGRGPFNREGQPDGCDWVLTFRERLVEERGCFKEGKRHGPWETCRLSLDPQEGAAAQQNCPKTEYEMGAVVVKIEEPAPEPELVEEGGAEERMEGVKPETDKSGR